MRVNQKINNSLFFFKIFAKQLPRLFQSIFASGFRYALLTMIEESFFQIKNYKFSSAILKYKINYLILGKHVIIHSKQTNQDIQKIDKVNIELSADASDLYQLDDLDITSRRNFLYVFDIYKYFILYGNFKFAAWVRLYISNLVSNAIINKKVICSESILFSSLDISESSLKIFLDNEKLYQNFKIDFFPAYVFLKKLISKDANTIPSTGNEGYKKYISNKSIAVVGPSNMDINTGKEIDKLEKIIRLNFSKKTQLLKETHGSQSHITYYNHAAVKKRPQDIIESSNQLDWVNFKDDNDMLTLQFSRFNLQGRVYKVADDLFYFGSAMGLQNIVYDLFLCQAERVHLFGFDFYCSKNPYQPDYPSKETRAFFQDNFSKAASYSLRMHDPLINFHLIKRMYCLKKIYLADSVKKILDLSIEHYAQKLEELYGEFNLSND